MELSKKEVNAIINILKIISLKYDFDGNQDKFVLKISGTLEFPLTKETKDIILEAIRSK